MAKRQYDNDYVSVTGLLSILSNYGLMEWFKRTPYAQILEESNKGKTIGKQLHDVIQSHIDKQEAKIETEYPEEVSTALKSFMLFKKDNPNIKLNKAELMLISDKYKLNGTLDCTAEENGIPILLDWKSAKCGTEKDKPPIYNSYLYQVSAYDRLYREQEGIKFEYAYVVALAKDKVSYNMEKIDAITMNNHFENIIIPCLNIFYYEKENKKKL